MKLLAVDTATEACSVALWDEGRIVERYEVAVRTHSARLPVMVAEILADAGWRATQLDGLVAGIGPGSFAGVRIGVSFIKGMALGASLPTVGVSSLAMLAQASLSKNPELAVLAAIDARMDEVYCGGYRNEGGVARLVAEDRVVPPAAIAELTPASPYAAVGSGWDVYRQALDAVVSTAPASVDGQALPHAADALTLAAPIFASSGGFDAATLVPAYLRNRVALTRVEQEAARAARSQGAGG